MIMLSSKESTRQHHIHLNKNTWVHKSAVKCHYLTILTHIFSFIIHHSMEHFNNIRDIHYYSTDWSHFLWHEDIICIINACLQSFTIEVEISNALAWSGAVLAFTLLNEFVKILISFIEQLFGYIEQRVLQIIILFSSIESAKLFLELEQWLSNDVHMLEWH